MLQKDPLHMIPVCEPVLGGNEKKYVLECLETNWISSAGKFLDRFEEMVRDQCGARHAIACSSCTTGLHLAFEAIGLKTGDEVIVPAFNLIAGTNMVVLAGGKPVLVDSDPETWCMDARKIAEKITPRTKAIMPVHMYGHPCDMDPIMELAKKHNLAVIEDVAEAHGAEYKGKALGAIGHLGCFSFYANKNITTGEGGMVVTNDDAHAKKIRMMRNQGFQQPRFVHEIGGFNYRLTNLQAAIGVAQMERLDAIVKRRRELAAQYRERLQGQRGVRVATEAKWAKSVYWQICVVLTDEFGATKDDVMSKLHADGVETRSFFCPMNLQPLFSGKNAEFPDLRGSYPVSEHLWNHGLYLPSGLNLSDSQIDEVVAKLLKCRK
jgi:perosamine synthetase